MIDYHQPDFFHFGHDSLFLVDCLKKHAITIHPIEHFIELGVGSGVITCELQASFKMSHIHLVDVQWEMWWPSLKENLKKTHIHFFKEYPCAVSAFNTNGSIQAELIVANPPYYLRDEGRLPLDERRQVSHFFMMDPPLCWWQAMSRSLISGGQAWWPMRKNSQAANNLPLFCPEFKVELMYEKGLLQIFRMLRL